MMRKCFLEYDKEFNKYLIIKDGQTINLDLLNLWESFYPTHDWIQIDEFDEGWITIWDLWDVKDKKFKEFISLEEKRKYDEAYRQYSSKRWKEIPLLEMTKENHEQVLKQWERLKKSKAPFGIISIDDTGWVRVEGKDKLDQQDLQDMKEEYQRYINFTEKWDAYRPFLNGKQDFNKWESEADSEFYSDFLTEGEMVWKKKNF